MGEKDPVSFLDTVRYISSKEKIECVSYVSPEEHIAKQKARRARNKTRRMENANRVTFREDMPVVAEELDRDERLSVREMEGDDKENEEKASQVSEIEEVTTKIVYKSRRIIAKPVRKAKMGKESHVTSTSKKKEDYASNDVFFKTFVQLESPGKKHESPSKLLLPPKRGLSHADRFADSRAKSSSPALTGPSGIKRDLTILKPTGNAAIDRQYSSSCDILPDNNTFASQMENLPSAPMKKERISTKSNFSIAELSERASFIRQKSFMDEQSPTREKSFLDNGQTDRRKTGRHEKITARDVRKFRAGQLPKPSLLPSLSRHSGFKLPDSQPYGQRPSKLL